LIGVPFEYLIPDPRLLPDESIRFFYIDRSWTDRLVDGAIAVGKIGTREQAHHHAHHSPVKQTLDVTEHAVRRLQTNRGRDTYETIRAEVFSALQQAQVVTGFLLRSAAVSGWPHMDVRAYSADIPEPLDPKLKINSDRQLKTLRLERLSPAVMFALFEGVPKLVFLEEPHHSVQFGVRSIQGQFRVDLRKPDGHQVFSGVDPIPVTVPVRAANSRVVHVAQLRKNLHQQAQTHAGAIQQDGPAAFAVQVLDPPWRQRFEGTVDHAEKPGGSGGFVSVVLVAKRVTQATTRNAVIKLFQP
jgi:hypothetical protein